MNINSNIRKLAILFIACFMALSAGLVYWQVVVAQQVTANIHNSRKYLTSNAPVRGTIYDRNGVPLAYSVLTPNGYIRHYTEPSLAGLIGYYAGPSFPATGLEAQYNNYLSGKVGVTALGNTVNQLLHRPPVGDNIYLTIDARIQAIAARDFNEAITIDHVNTFPSDRGSAIITDPHTGEILAMVSNPTFDPNKMVQTLAAGDTSYYDQEAAQHIEQPLLERPLQAYYPPGSIYKTLTLSAALDSGHTTLNQHFSQQQALGPVYYDGHAIGPVGNNIQGYTFHFPVTTQYGFTHSDNVIFAQVGVETGQSTWLNYNRRFYVGQQIPFDLPVLPSHVRKNGQPLTTVDLASDSFGQGYDVMTPMQMSLIDNAVANNGQLMRPMLVQKITDPSKAVVQINNPQALGAQQITSKTAAEVRQAMYGVSRCGSASIYVPGVQIGGSPWGIISKTGTAQLSSSGNVPADAWMVTQAPYSITSPTQLPSLTIVAMRENGGEGGQDVGPMITSMYNDIFTNVIKTPLPAQPDPNYCFKTGLLQ